MLSLENLLNHIDTNCNLVSSFARFPSHAGETFKEYLANERKYLKIWMDEFYDSVELEFGRANFWFTSQLHLLWFPEGNLLLHIFSGYSFNIFVTVPFLIIAVKWPAYSQNFDLSAIKIGLD